MRTTLARWLVVGSLAGIGLLAGAGIAVAQEATPSPTPEAAAAPQAAAAAPADSAVQGSNSATDAAATTADAAASNDATVGAGPSASGGGGQSSQIGDNDIRVSQRSSARTGDAVAGAQVIGVVGGSAVIQAQNSSVGAVAESGEAIAENSLEIGAGPSGSSAQQFGDNRVRVVQESFAESGSAIAGAQVTGLVDADALVQNQNFSEDAEAVSGDAEAINDLELDAGPFASSVDGTASVAQVGDNDAVFTQSSEALSGDAVAGGQISGIVGDDATVQNQNFSTDPEAESGSVLAENSGVAVTAPRAGPEASDAAQVSQLGDNELDAAQDASARSGDAVAGSQVTGMVSEERGHLTVQNQQSSDEPIATSGDAEAVNDLEVDAGAGAESVDGDIAQAAQNGDNDVDVEQVTEAVTGDAVAGAQITGGVGGDGAVQNSNVSDGAEAVSGDAEAESTADVAGGAFALTDGGDAAFASQFGDNRVDLVQDTSAASGDAVAGGQVTGLVGGVAVVQGQNAADAPVAESGEAVALSDAEATGGASAEALDGVASVSQSGDNRTDVGQTTAAVSGDAVAGAGVFGVVGDDGFVQASNFATDPEAISGDADVESTIEASAGAVAESDDETAMASQFGDNRTDIDQVAVGTSGDAVAGSQVVGAVSDASGHARAQLQAASEDAEAESGEVVVLNDAALATGPVASALDGFASVSQFGDNDLDLRQDVEATTGDAVAGGQVVGAVGSGFAGDATIQGSLRSDGDEALTADAEAGNSAEGSLGPLAEADGAAATASQSGDNDEDVDQTLEVVTGDAVSGGQVFGRVA